MQTSTPSYRVDIKLNRRPDGLAEGGEQEVTIARRPTPFACPKYSAVPTPGVFFVSIPVPGFVQRTKRSARSSATKRDVVAQPPATTRDKQNDAICVEPKPTEPMRDGDQSILLEIPVPGFVPRTTKARANCGLPEVDDGSTPSTERSPGSGKSTPRQQGSRRGARDPMCRATAKIVENVHYDPVYVPNPMDEPDTIGIHAGLVSEDERVTVPFTGDAAKRATMLAKQGKCRNATEGQRVAATLLSIRTSHGAAAFETKDTSEWDKYVRRKMQGADTQTIGGSVLSVEGTASVVNELDEGRRERGELCEAPLLTPDAARRAKAQMEAEAMLEDIDSGALESAPSLEALAETTAVGFMKHLQIGENAEISPDGQYTLVGTGAADATDVDDTKHASRYNVPLQAQIAYERSDHDSMDPAQSFYSIFGAVPLQPSKATMDAFMGADRFSTTGIATVSPMVRELAKLFTYRPQPALHSAAMDMRSKTSGYQRGQRPRVSVDPPLDAHTTGGQHQRRYNYEPRLEDDVMRVVDSAMSHADYYPIVIPVSYEVESNFLREPVAQEPLCVNGVNCEGQHLKGIPKMTLVAFYVLISMMKRYRTKLEEMARQHPNDPRYTISSWCRDAVQNSKGGGVNDRRKKNTTRNGVLAEATFCVLCYRKLAHTYSWYINGCNATLTRSITIVPYRNLVGVEGEYTLEECTFNPSTAHTGLAGPVAWHHASMYSFQMKNVDGVNVRGLRQHHTRVRMNTVVDF